MVLIDITKPRYERRGRCNMCGECCKNEECDNFNGRTCINHTEQRQIKCKDFPFGPPIMFEKCGYYFYDKWENKELRYKEI